MQKNRSVKLLFIVLAMAMLFAFSAVSAQEPTTFGGAWPYQVPPTGHLNMFATNRLDLGIYLYLRFPNYATYHWATGEYEGQLADLFGFDEDNNYVVTLKSGITWSDGAPLTSADAVSTFNILYLLNDQIWRSVSSVEAVDDLTFKFTVTAPSRDLERRILTQRPQSSSVYGDLAATAAEQVAAGGAAGDADFDAAVTALTEFRPETEVAVGPYVLDFSTVTDFNIILTKNEGGYASDTVLFDTITVWNGETEAVTPLVANGDVSYATHGFPPRPKPRLSSRVSTSCVVLATPVPRSTSISKFRRWIASKSVRRLPTPSTVSQTASSASVNPVLPPNT